MNAPAISAGLLSGRVTCTKVRHLLEPEVPRRFDQALVDPVQERVEHEDQVRDVPVDEAEDDRDRLAAEPVGVARAGR